MKLTAHASFGATRIARSPSKSVSLDYKSNIQPSQWTALRCHSIQSSLLRQRVYHLILPEMKEVAVMDAGTSWSSAARTSLLLWANS